MKKTAASLVVLMMTLSLLSPIVLAESNKDKRTPAGKTNRNRLKNSPLCGFC